MSERLVTGDTVPATCCDCGAETSVLANLVGKPLPCQPCYLRRRERDEQRGNDELAADHRVWRAMLECVHDVERSRRQVVFERDLPADFRERRPDWVKRWKELVMRAGETSRSRARRAMP